MLGKFKGGTEWVVPLLAHALVHGVGTIIIALMFGSKTAFALGCLDMWIHFIVDRIKASPNLLGRYEALSKGEANGLIDSRVMCEHAVQRLPPASKANAVAEAARRIEEIDARFASNKKFWWALGADQMAHHLTHYAIIYMIIVVR